MPYKNRLTVRKRRENYPVTSKEKKEEGGWEDGVDNQALQLGFTRISLSSKLIGYAIISSGPDSKMELTRQVVYDIETKSVTVTINDRVVPWDNKSPSETLKAVAQCKSCQGNTDLNIASAAVYSTGCTVLLESTTHSTRCPPCLKERKAMQKRIIRSNEQSTSQVSRVDPSSKVQLKSLSKEELLTRSRNMRKEINSKTSECKRLSARLAKLIECESISVETETSDLCQSLISSSVSQFEPDSMKKLFLEQQLKANSVNKSALMRWHPSIIRWCLVVHNKSKAAYQYMRDSEVVNLPSERTLRDYVAFRPMETGTQCYEIMNVAQKYGQQDVALCFDEMKVKEGLVYCPHSGKLTGYVDTLDADSLLDVTSKSLEKIATHALAFQIRGLKSDLQSVVGTYATSSLNAEGLYLRFWETVANLELAGFRVRIAVSDGAATNRKFYNLHKSDFPDDSVTYRAYNKFSSDGRVLYFASDTCHLVKTSRNCLERSGPNSNRQLILKGKHIYWYHITQLVDSREAGVISTTHHLTKQHINLQSYSRMKVKYAVQVLSRRTYKALQNLKNDEYDSTVELLRYINNVFDILNMRSRNEGARSRNKYKSPLTSSDDWRFEYVEGFIAWLNDWETEVASKQMSAEDSAKCLLSPATRDGWKITCMSFMKLSKDLLAEGYAFILTEKLLCQDPTEQYFSRVRNSTGSNNAPTMAQFNSFTRLHSATKSAQRDLKTGNTTTGAKPKLRVSEQPMPKRARKTPKRLTL